MPAVKASFSYHISYHMLASRSYVQVVKTLKASNEQNRFVQVQVLLYLRSNQSGEDGKSFHLRGKSRHKFQQASEHCLLLIGLVVLILPLLHLVI